MSHNSPVGTSIKVYFKGLHESDDSDIRRDQKWVEMEYAETNPRAPSGSQRNFIDTDFKLPSSVLNSDNVFEYSTKRITTVTISDGGSGYPTADDAPVFIDNADGTGAEIEVTTVNGSGTITAVELVNPGRNFGSSAPTITVGLDHDFSREYAINTVVADASHTPTPPMSTYIRLPLVEQLLLLVRILDRVLA